MTVVRLLAFYTGMIPDVEEWRRNPFCGVKPLTPIEIINLQDKVSSTYSLKQGYRQTFRELVGTAEDEHLQKVRELAVTLKKQRDGGFSYLMNGKTDLQIEEYYQYRAQEMERRQVQNTRKAILNIFEGNKKAQEIMKVAQLVEDIAPT